MSKMPSDDVLESLRKLRKRESAQLKTVLELYDMEIHQKLRQRNFDARNERIETGAVVTIRKGQRGVGRGQGECHQWKAKKDSGREETCSYRHDEDRMVTSVQWLYPVGLRISGHRAAGIFIDFTEEPNSLRINSTSAIHKSCAASCKHPRKRSAARKNSADRRIIFIFFLSIEKPTIFFKWQADQASQGEQAALTKISEAEYHTRLLLEEQKKPLSEARSETNMQESRVESADRAGSP